QPAEVAALAGVDVARMDWTVDGRLPAEVDAVVMPAPEPHAAGGEDRVGEGAVVDFDEVHAVAQAAAQGALVDRPVVGAAELQAVAAGGEGFEPNVVDDVGERPGAKAFHGSAPCLAATRRGARAASRA